MLYDKIKNAGYQSQKQLRTLRPWDEVRVCIGRNGDVLFHDGRHRLAIAKALEIERIPVVVTRIHKSWYMRLVGANR